MSAMTHSFSQTENQSSHVLSSLKEWYIKKIVDACQHGRGVQYLVCYKGYGKEYDEWHPGSEMANMDALDKWKDENGTQV